MNNKKVRKGIDVDSGSYIRMFIYVFLIIIIGAAFLRLNYDVFVGEAYLFTGDKISGTLDVPDSGFIEENITVNLELDVSDVDRGIILIANVDPGLEIIKPISDGLVGSNTVTWTLFPENQIVSFDVLANSSGDYNISMVWMVDGEKGNVFDILNIIVCDEGDVRDYICADGSSVPWCVCEQGEWGCIISPESACPIITCIDNDNDDYNQSAIGCGIADCNDNDAFVYPDADEVCDNDVDDDCDSLVDCADGDCAGDSACICTDGETKLCSNQEGVCQNSMEECTNNQWLGCDHTLLPDYETDEVSCDGLDNDCDGLIDEGCVIDNDNDGYSPPDDCDDNNADIYPDADEICDDGVDNDCDDLIDLDDTDCMNLIVPTDGMIINQSVILGPGIYDLPNGIRIDTSNIIIDGNGATLRGSGLGEEWRYGIILLAVNNVTIRNLNVENYDVGIFPHSSTEINIYDNNISGYHYPIHTYLSNVSIFNNNIIKQNSSLNTFTHAIDIYYSCHTNINSNNIQSFGRGNAINLEFVGWPGGIDCNVTIKHNNITTYNYSTEGIYSLGVIENEDISYQIIYNNIQTYGRSAHGIEMFRSISNISYNNIITQGRHADGIHLSYSDNNIVSYNNFEIIKEYIYPGGSIIFFNNSWPIVETESSNNIILNNIVNGICSCSSEEETTGGGVGQAFEALVEDVSGNYSYVCTLIELDVYAIVDLNDNRIIETSELLEAIDKWLIDEVETSIILEAINIWKGLQ